MLEVLETNSKTNVGGYISFFDYLGFFFFSLFLSHIHFIFFIIINYHNKFSFQLQNLKLHMKESFLQKIKLIRSRFLFINFLSIIISLFFKKITHKMKKNVFSFS